MGLWLFSFEGHRLAVFQRDADPRTGRQTATLEVLATGPGTANEFLADFRVRMDNHSVLKGQVISLVMSEYGPNTAGVTFLHRPSLPASDVIRPDGLLPKVAPVSDSHLAAAVEDLMADAETLTRSLLGSGTDAAGSL
ncbi:hypothetical protein [Pseudarthrobacter sp. NBSH8]|uniref:hypothetical protein n=1 Tax=Pseudarthrobacter sp. NBSH8 TaxID=2596911 RepID=UPI001629F0A7|nr:hypothetical protein [Pseudarthrobacter sp. NBSH8]QNE15783.1 hypothetical protein FYJ92_16105 [Pseudarthrobacter sp. NBSH8]